MITAIILSFVAGALLVALLVFLIWWETKKKSLKLVKDFKWKDILRKEEFTQLELARMYIASKTFGECATGELFGSLARLQVEMQPVLWCLYRGNV